MFNKTSKRTWIFFTLTFSKIWMKSFHEKHKQTLVTTALKISLKLKSQLSAKTERTYCSWKRGKMIYFRNPNWNIGNCVLPNHLSFILRSTCDTATSIQSKILLLKKKDNIYLQLVCFISSNDWFNQLT